jgi:hypothetical protein
MNLLMNPTMSLTNQIPRIIRKLFPKLVQEEIIPHNLHSFLQLPLRTLKIKLHIQLLQEPCNFTTSRITFRTRDETGLGLPGWYAAALRERIAAAER